MNYIKLQKFYVRSLFISNQIQNNNNIKSIFKSKFNIILNLTISEISYEKHIAFGNTNLLILYIY